MSDQQRLEESQATKMERDKLSEKFGCVDTEFMVSDGTFCNLFDPPRKISFEVMVGALSKQCRFNGHTRWFYSVAQHSVLVSRVLSPELAPYGLLHDAAEAYLGDVIRPIKYGAGMEAYRAAEKVWQRVIYETFGLDSNLSTKQLQELMIADNRMLMTEFRDLFPRTPPGLEGTAEPYDSFIVRPLGPEASEAVFCERFAELFPSA